MSAPPPTYLQLLQQAKQNYLMNLVALSALIKPDYSVDGQGVQWLQYQMSIINQAIEHLNVLIQIEGGPQALDTIAIPGGGSGGGYIEP